MDRITLATLPQATAQQVFDQVSRHLLKQNMHSAGAVGTCQYRVECLNGPLLCAAGCLIAPEEYDGTFEGNNWLDLATAGHVPSEHSALIRRLQMVHDYYPPGCWALELWYAAGDLGLNPVVLDEAAQS